MRYTNRRLLYFVLRYTAVSLIEEKLSFRYNMVMPDKIIVPSRTEYKMLSSCRQQPVRYLRKRRKLLDEQNGLYCN